MIFPLVQDFADALAALPREHPRYRVLKLLDEAIGRDVHFIDRHPTTFFQCLWNGTNDSQDAAGQIAKPAEPLESSEAALWRLVQYWHQARMHADTDRVWFRSIGLPIAGAQPWQSRTGSNQSRRSAEAIRIRWSRTKRGDGGDFSRRTVHGSSTPTVIGRTRAWIDRVGPRYPPANQGVVRHAG